VAELTKFFQDSGSELRTTAIASDYRAIFRKTQALADNGDTNAAVDVGQMMWKGLGTARNHIGAVQYYQIAAEAGIAKAMLHLASAYAEGDGTSCDISKAL
jgi:TPR repeat protein